MKKQDCYYWRLFATGLSFTAFGIGGLFIGLVAFPLLNLASPNKATRQRRARKLNHQAFRLFIGMMKLLGVLTYDDGGIKGQLNQPGQLVIANHPTLIDVCFLISFIEQANCIVKLPLFKNPFTKGALSNANYIANINGEQLLTDSRKSILRGESLIVFPEGTRTPPRELRPKLQRGAANIALASQTAPIAVTIKCEPLTLSKGNPWYRIPNSRPHWTFSLSEAIILPDYAAGPKAARELNRHITDHFFPHHPKEDVA